MTDQSYHYIAYIDESGDAGLNAVRPIDEGGSSEWLVMSAVVIRACREENVTEWLAEMKSDLNLDQKAVLHFRNLSPTRRLRLASCLASKPARAFVVCSNKKNMRQYRNAAAEKISSQQWFYNWCLRLLLERVTAFCEQRRELDYPGENCRLKIEFSRRKGHSYSQTRAYTYYLRHQEKANSLFLTKRKVLTDLLSRDLMIDLPHKSSSGLQLADIVASAFFSAANTIGPGDWDLRPAKALRRIMAVENGRQACFGVSLHPTPPIAAKLTNEQEVIFRYYGYEFSGPSRNDIF